MQPQPTTSWESTGIQAREAAAQALQKRAKLSLALNKVTLQWSQKQCQKTNYRTFNLVTHGSMPLYSSAAAQLMQHHQA